MDTRSSLRQVCHKTLDNLSVVLFKYMCSCLFVCVGYGIIYKCVWVWTLLSFFLFDCGGREEWDGLLLVKILSNSLGISMALFSSGRVLLLSGGQTFREISSLWQLKLPKRLLLLLFATELLIEAGHSMLINRGTSVIISGYLCFIL